MAVDAVMQAMREKLAREMTHKPRGPGILAGEIPKRSTILPVSRDEYGRVVPAWPQMALDAWRRAKLPGEALMGEAQPTPADTMEMALGAIGGGAAFGSVPRGALGANAVRLWHGSPKSFDQFDSVGPVWFSNNKGYSEGLAGRKNLSTRSVGNLYEADVSIENPLIVDVQRKARRELEDAGIDWEDLSPEEIEQAFTGGLGYEHLVSAYSQDVKSGGHDALVFKGTLDGYGSKTDQYVLFDPGLANIVSRNGESLALLGTAGGAAALAGQEND